MRFKANITHAVATQAEETMQSVEAACRGQRKTLKEDAENKLNMKCFSPINFI